MDTFKSKIDIIGVNPFVPVSDKVLKNIFREAKKEKGPIPVCGKIDNHNFIQTLVKYSGKWRLYINTPMLKAAKAQVGDTVTIQIKFDPAERIIPMHPGLEEALRKNKQSKEVFDQLPPSSRREIIRYISFLKTEDAIERNVSKAIKFLLGQQRFVGRDKP